MSTIITKFSDYSIQSINYFIKQIKDGLNYRDLKGLTNNKIEIINVSKQQPLAMMMAAQLQENRNADPLQSGILPAIGVTPGNISEGGFTLGQGYKPEIVDDTFIDDLKIYLNKTTKETIEDLMITKDQINLIIGAYRRAGAGNTLCQRHQWRKNEEVNISVWSETPDIDILIGNIVDSILADIQVGFTGDNSLLMNMQFKVSKGLTNFNFGRVIFGSEYNLTFTNTYNNYTIYTETKISDFESSFTFVVPGDE